MKKLLILVILLVACENQRFGATEKGALAGTAIGSGLGAIIGNQSGNAGAGVAIGAAVGALGGGLIGHGIQGQHDQLDAREAELARQQQMIDENKAMIDELRSRGMDVRKTDRGVVVNLPDVLFEFNKSDLTSDARRATDEIAGVINRYPDRTISVEGHTDSLGTVSYNKRLSEDRARSVADDLAAQGVSRSKLRTYGFGESDPISSNRTELGRQRNRRVEVIIENSKTGGFAVDN